MESKLINWIYQKCLEQISSNVVEMFTWTWGWTERSDIEVIVNSRRNAVRECHYMFSCQVFLKAKNSCSGCDNVSHVLLEKMCEMSCWKNWCHYGEVQWLAKQPHGKKVLGSNPSASWGFSANNLSAWVSLGSLASFHSLCLCVSPVIDSWTVQGEPPPLTFSQLQLQPWTGWVEVILHIILYN